MEIMESIPLLAVRREPLQAAYNRALKRTFDILFFFGYFTDHLSDTLCRYRNIDKSNISGPVFFKQKAYRFVRAGI